jgi:multicomponent Na+:H+ antiporter subunit D
VNALIGLPIVLPLLAAGVSIGVGRSRAAQRVISLATLASLVATTAVLLARVDSDGITTVHVGRWRAPVGIALVADRLSALLLLTALVTLLAVLVFAIGQPGRGPGNEGRHVGFHPLYLVLTAGISFAFLTGDLFNLFVAFEVMLMASYALLTLGGRADQVRAGMTYVVISLVASMLFLAALAYVYAATGTVNMADLHGKVAALPPGVRRALAILLIVVFGIKAAIFPLFFWLPDSYPTAPTAVTAVFAGLLTKIGVYTLIRTQTVLFTPDTRPGTLLLVVASITMVVGVLGAVAQTDVKRLLSFHIVSQIGYMVMGLGLFTVAGVAGAIVFTVHQMLVKTALFLVGGLVEEKRGTGRLSRLGGLARTEPFLAVLFLLSALSLAGIPPLSGFVGKLALVEAGLDDGSYVVVGVSLAVSLLTLFSMNKIWSNAFWGATPEDATGGTVTQRGNTTLMTVGTAVLVVASVVVAVLAGPLHEVALRASADLVDPAPYVEAVLGR